MTPFSPFLITSPNLQRRKYMSISSQPLKLRDRAIYYEKIKRTEEGQKGSIMNIRYTKLGFLAQELEYLSLYFLT